MPDPCSICRTEGHKLSCPNREGGQLSLPAHRTQPEALRLADALDRDGYACFTDDMCAAAAELRRLHAEVERLAEECRIRKECDQGMQQSLGEYHAERDELRVEVGLLKAEVERLNDKVSQGLAGAIHVAAQYLPAEKDAAA